MSLIKLVPAAALVLSISLPASAADLKMTGPNETRVHIKCDSSNCRVKEKTPDTKWRTVENTQGGSRNFDKLKAKYQEAGFK
nr:hypothetical protein [Roseovarius sp. W115]MDV2930677.1 hypothetical protein [Roseovarius sp. W115]